MAAALPVRGSVLSSAPCSLQEAAGMLQRFLSSEGAAESGIVKGYLESVSRSLHEVVSRVDTTLKKPSFPDPTDSKSEEELVEDLKSEEVENAKETAQAVMNFEALLGREDENAFASEFDKRLNGEILSENEFEDADMVARTQSSAFADENDVKPSKRKKKKKEKDLGEATKEAAEGVLASAIGGKAQDEERIDKVTSVPADQEGRKKKMKKHKEKPPLEKDFLTKERSDDMEVDVGNLSSKSHERGREGDGSAHADNLQEIKEKKKTKKRTADQSPGEHRVSKKSRKSG